LWLLGLLVDPVGHRLAEPIEAVFARCEFERLDGPVAQRVEFRVADSEVAVVGSAGEFVPRLAGVEPLAELGVGVVADPEAVGGELDVPVGELRIQSVPEQRRVGADDYIRVFRSVGDHPHHCVRTVVFAVDADASVGLKRRPEVILEGSGETSGRQHFDRVFVATSTETARDGPQRRRADRGQQCPARSRLRRPSRNHMSSHRSCCVD